jgi:hypothetical protein
MLDHVEIHTEKTGGVGKTVEIDENKFGKRKYKRGHHVKGQWVFGGVERRSGKTSHDRTAETLNSTMKQWIHPSFRQLQLLVTVGYLIPLSPKKDSNIKR